MIDSETTASFRLFWDALELLVEERPDNKNGIAAPAKAPAIAAPTIVAALGALRSLTTVNLRLEWLPLPKGGVRLVENPGAE